MAETDPDAGSGDYDARISRLEDGQGKILARLDQLLTGKTGKPEDGDGAPAPNGRPEDMAAMVRAELARAEQEKSDAAKQAAEKAEHETLKERVARLTEVTPAPPQPRRQRAMWGARR